jgi:hypothetical protein
MIMLLKTLLTLPIILISLEVTGTYTLVSLASGENNSRNVFDNF